MSLKNTDYIFGLVIFTGHETKVMKNSAESKYKKSRLDLFADMSVKYLFVAQIILVVTIGVYAIFPLGEIYDRSKDKTCYENHPECAAKTGDDKAACLKY